MIDLVEARIISRQIVETLRGRRVAQACLAERKMRSMRDAYMLRLKPREFAERFTGAKLTDAYSRYRSVLIETDAGYGLDLFDIYGRILYVDPGSKSPGNPPIRWQFEDGGSLAVLPGVWGGLRIRSNDALRAIRDEGNPERLDPFTPEFTAEALADLIARRDAKLNIKRVLTMHAPPSIVGVMGAVTQEVLYRAKLDPRRKAPSLSQEEIATLHGAIVAVLRESLTQGGRHSERDLYNRRGAWKPTVSKATLGMPCPVCGALIATAPVGGGGKFYCCPGCQQT